jgi:RND family efflux transporter MFP subunit
VYIERGAVVRAGEPLVRLFDADLRSAAATASAARAQAGARLGLEHPGAGRPAPERAPEVRVVRARRDAAEAEMRRALELASRRLISDQDYQRIRAEAIASRESYRVALATARAQFYEYQGATAAAEQSERLVREALVRAPFDGEVAERRINVGEYATTARPVATLVRTDPLRLVLQVPQDRIMRIELQQRVEVAVDAVPDRVFQGVVRYVSPVVRADERLLPIEAVVPNPDGALRAGASATARVDLGRRRHVVAVPTRALVAEDGRYLVYVLRDGRAHERVVVLSDRSGSESLLGEGVAAGEQVALDSLDQLYDGAAVSVRADGTPAAAPPRP